MKEALESVGRFAIAMMNIIAVITYVLVKIMLVHIPRLFLAGIDIFIRVFFEMPLNMIFKNIVFIVGETDE